MRRLILLFVALAALAGCGGDVADSSTSAEAAEAEEATTESPPRIGLADLGPCKGKPEITGEFRCGSIEVPKFRAAPEKGSFEIGFAYRERDEQGEPAGGTIVAVEGGPGYATTGTANAFLKLFDGLLKTRDLVLVDMRGTGRSGPVRCPDVQEGTAPEFIALSECARRLGDDWEAYNTGAAADDVNAVREALGLGKISLYGDSYGTFLGQSYAFRHPETLSALVLDGAYPVKGESAWYPSLITTGNEAMETACDRAPNCTGSATRRLEKAAKYMRRNGMNPGTLIDAVAGSAYGPPGSYRTVDRAIRNLLAGNARSWRRLNFAETTAAKDRFSYSRTEEFIVGCNDYPMIWDRNASEEERRAQLEAEIRAYDENAFEPFTPREVAIASEVGYLECLTWPQPTELRDPPVRAGDEPTEAPVLVVNGELDDLTTPFEGGLVADFFPNSRRFVERNAGHVASLYYPDGPSARVIRAFLEDPEGN